MNRKITICFPFTGDVVGGSHMSALGLITALDPQRFRKIVLVQHPDGAIARLFRGSGIEVERSPSRASMAAASPISAAAVFRSLSDLRQQIAFLRAQKVDIVHTNDGGTHATWALAARLSGARLLWHHRADPSARGLRLVAPLLADRVVAVSEFSLPPRGLYSAAYKSEVLHSPFDTSVSEDRAAARQKLIAECGFPDNAWCIAYVGAFIDRKRPLLFVDTIAKLRDSGTTRPAHGFMFGEALDREAEERLKAHIASLGVEDRVHLMGWRTPGTFWIAACDQLLVPAVSEPFGRTLVEAMLVGTPIVATRSGGNVEALKRGSLGLLVEPEDADALAAASASLEAQPALALEFAGKASADARVRFGRERHVSRIEQIYEDLVGSRCSAVEPNGAGACIEPARQG